MKRLRAYLAALIHRLSSWPVCACGRRHDPREHYGLHDEPPKEPS